ncbi:unnamed protein product [Cercospora beticola]|nr:unnamed protein product [Cercospora beticola]
MTGQFPPNFSRAAYFCILGRRENENPVEDGQKIWEVRHCMCTEGRWIPDRYPPRSSQLKSFIYDSHVATKYITIEIVDALERWSSAPMYEIDGLYSIRTGRAWFCGMISESNSSAWVLELDCV